LYTGILLRANRDAVADKLSAFVKDYNPGPVEGCTQAWFLNSPLPKARLGNNFLSST